MDKFELYTEDEVEFIEELLGFLEEVYAERGIYEISNGIPEKPIDVLILNFTKVVNDCRAMLLLALNGFYIQSAIVARSTMDACNLMFRVALEGDDSGVARKWPKGVEVKHWDLINKLNEKLLNKLNIDLYRSAREDFDDFVHGNFNGVKVYPAQAPGPTPMDKDSFEKVRISYGVLHLCLITCLLLVGNIAPEFEDSAKFYLNALGFLDD